MTYASKKTQFSCNGYLKAVALKFILYKQGI